MRGGIIRLRIFITIRPELGVPLRPTNWWRAITTSGGTRPKIRAVRSQNTGRYSQAAEIWRWQRIVCSLTPRFARAILFLLTQNSLPLSLDAAYLRTVMGVTYWLLTPGS